MTDDELDNIEGRLHFDEPIDASEVRALVAEVRQLRARVATLEGGIREHRDALVAEIRRLRVAQRLSEELVESALKLVEEAHPGPISTLFKTSKPSDYIIRAPYFRRLAKALEAWTDHARELERP